MNSSKILFDQLDIVLASGGIDGALDIMNRPEFNPDYQDPLSNMGTSAFSMVELRRPDMFAAMIELHGLNLVITDRNGDTIESFARGHHRVSGIGGFVEQIEAYKEAQLELA